MHRSVFVMLAAAALLFAEGCDKKKGDQSAATGATSAASPAGARQPHIFKVTPEAFYKEFGANQEATHEKYHTGVVEITGLVDEVGANMAGDSVVNIRAGTEKDPTGAYPVVQCVTTETEPWAKVAKGQQATLRGDVGYLPFGANMKDCTVEAAGPAMVLTVTPAQLAGSYAADKEGFKKTYSGKNLIVTGKVVERTEDRAGAITLFLEGAGETRIQCDFGMIESVIKKAVPAVKVGQQVQVFGEIQHSDKPSPAVPMTSCRLITK